MDQSTDADSIRSKKRSGFTKVFAGRRHKRGTSSPASVRSSEPLTDDSGGLRQSIDDALGKLKEKARNSSESRRNSVDSLSGSKRIARVFRKRRKSDLAREGDEDALGANGRGLGYDMDVSPSEESLGLAKSVASSQLTEDSDLELPPARPSLSPHQSHVGYLTLSSPLINHDIVETSSSRHSSSPPATSQNDTLAPKHASGSELQPAERDSRGSSPGRKLKEAFQPIKKSATSRTTAEVKPSGNGGGGGGLGSLFAGGRKSRSSSRVSLVDDAPQNQESAEQPPPIPPLSLKRQVTPQRVETVPNPPSTPPNTVDAPTTLVTPPTPTDSRPNTFLRPSTTPRVPEPPPNLPKRPESPAHKPSHSNPNIVVSPTGNLSHRRSRSATNPPSKLSNAVFPLTPTAEETKTPGGSLASPTSGFFSSVFSAAQNAANQFTNSVTSINTGQRSRSGTNPETEAEKIAVIEGGEEVIGGASDPTKDEEPQPKQLAVETLGSGDLSLSHLGIADAEPDTSTMISTVETAEGRPVTPLIQTDEVSARLEDSAASKAVSAAYLHGSSTFPSSGDRPRTATGVGDAITPPRQQGENGDSGLGRSGSIRSRMSERRQRRHRGSSATTGGPPIAPAINHSATTLTNASVGGTMNGSRLTGFAVASSKRNRDFHQQFRSVPEDDYLIEDYSAALQRDILLHGRLYVSEGHICFSSNILGWVTNLVISFDEVMSIEKKNTAVIFPNAIVIQTLHARNVFASLVSRDVTYDLLIGIWKISHPNLKSSLNGVALEAGTGDKTEKAESVDDALEDGSDEGSEEEVYDEDDEDDAGSGSFIEAGEGSIVGSDTGEVIKSVSRKPSAAFGAPISGGTAKDTTAAEAVAAGASATQDFPGPAMHAPTECGDEAQHYSNVLMDTTIPAPLGKVYSLMFGPASGQFMRKWLIDEQKSLDLQMEDDKKGLGEEKKAFGFSYIKPLNASIGPKQTKCIISQTLDQFDLEKAVTVTCSTQNPDVPSGNVFQTKTRYCLMWGPNNSTRMNMNCTIEWSGKSWLKGPIEKGTNDGQAAYAKDLVAALRAAVSAKPIGGGSKSGGKGGKGKNKRSKKDGTDSPNTMTSSAAATPAALSKGADWGILEPLHGPLSPVTDILGSFVSAPAIIAGLMLLIVVMWWRTPSGRSPAPYGYSTGSLGVPGLATPQRIVAYEEMWRREESELWDWLEERVGVERAAPVMSVKRQAEKKMQNKLEDERMSQRQIEEAIRVTQERLDVLRGAVERKHGGGEEKQAEGVKSESEL